MATKKEKRLSIAQLKPEVDAFDEYVEIDVTAQGQEYIVKMWPFFKPERIHICVKDMTQFFQQAQKEKFDISEDDQSDLVGYFIIKHFTNLVFTKSKKVKNIYDEFKIALNSPLFKTLMETFPKESIQSVYDRIFEVADASLMLKAQIEQAQEMVKNLPLENKELLEKLNVDHTLQ